LRKFILIFLILLMFCGNLISMQKFIVRLDNPSKLILKKIRTENYDIAAYKPNELVDIVVSEKEYQKLISFGYDPEIICTEDQARANLGNVRDLEGYRNYAEVLAELQQIEVDHSDICKLYDVGDSWGKIYADDGNSYYDDYHHEVWALKVSDNVLVEEDEPSVYYMGEHHAREPISLEVAMAVLNHILDNYGSDATITENVNNTQIWFIPLVNPNGHKVVTDEYDVWWRKNIRDNNENGQFDNYDDSGPDGVDPNRNYGFQWGNTGASNDWNSETYHGPEAFSEPEVQAMRDLLEAHHFIAGISYHSYSELVLFPFGYADGVIAPDHDALEELAVEMAESIPAQYGGHYTPSEAWDLYPCMGTTDDYAYGVHGIFSYTVELATEFIPPAWQVEGICEDNLNAALILLDRVNYSTLTGHITSSITREPIVAEIFIDGIDDTGVEKFPYQSDVEFGRYYRLLQDGNYNVTFSEYGYYPQFFSDVNINNSGQTILDVELEAIETIVDFSGVILDEQTEEPIENATVTFLDAPLESAYTNEYGEYYFPEVYIGIYNILISADGYSSIFDEIILTEESNEMNYLMQPSQAESFESGEFSTNWSFGGDADWFIDSDYASDGLFSARSGSIGSWDNSFLSISVDYEEASEISFFRKVSSEEGYDFLKFFIDGAVQGEWSGESDWIEESFAVSAGNHTFTWSYEKDGYVSDGYDCGWIDYVTLPPTYFVHTDDVMDYIQTKLYGNYPNPFSSSTTIKFNTENTEKNTEILIYNLKGQKVRTLDCIRQLPDAKATESLSYITWNGKDDNNKAVSSGIYLYKLKSGGIFSTTKKMILMR